MNFTLSFLFQIVHQGRVYLIKIAELQVHLENGRTSYASLEAKTKITALTMGGDDLQSLDTENKICNIAYDKVGTSTKGGGSLNDPQASLTFTTNLDVPRHPRVAGRTIFLKFEEWMQYMDESILDAMKIELADLTRYTIL